MGQTLPNGIYLPAEGERNCYDGLEGNWRSLDGLISTVSGKASATHTHGNITTDGKLATADRVVITDSTKSFTTSNVTATELGYLSGVTSAIQTQLNGKAADSDVVHKTGNESISGVKAFLNTNIRFNASSYVSGTPSDNIFYVPILIGGVVNNTDKNTFQHNAAIRTTGINDYAIRVYSQTSNTLTGVVAETNADASNISFRPIAKGTHNLGTSSYQWKTLNGINPGALSLPDLSSGTGVSLSAGANSYSPPSSGWLSINLTGAISVVCGDFCHSGTDMISVPVVKGSTYTVTVATSGTAYLFVSQGNV